MRWAVIAVHGPCIFQLLNGLVDELLSAECSLIDAFLRETCCKARLHVVPERLPRDVGKV